MEEIPSSAQVPNPLTLLNPLDFTQIWWILHRIQLGCFSDKSAYFCLLFSLSLSPTSPLMSLYFTFCLHAGSSNALFIVYTYAVFTWSNKDAYLGNGIEWSRWFLRLLSIPLTLSFSQCSRPDMAGNPAICNAGFLKEIILFCWLFVTSQPHDCLIGVYFNKVRLEGGVPHFPVSFPFNTVISWHRSGICPLEHLVKGCHGFWRNKITKHPWNCQNDQMKVSQTYALKCTLCVWFRKISHRLRIVH